MFDSYTFIELDVKMNYNTEGFLLMSDDVLLKYWSFDNHDINKIWFEKYRQKFDLNNATDNREVWWTSNVGRPAILNFLNFSEKELKNRQSLNKIEFEILEDFLQRTRLNSGIKNSYKQFNKAASDYFYLPKSKFKSFRFIGELVRKFNVFLEFAVSLILFGIEDETSIKHVNSTYFWFQDYSLKDIDRFGDLIHPFKLSSVYSKKNGFDFCEFFLYKKYNKTFSLS